MSASYSATSASALRARSASSRPLARASSSRALAPSATCSATCRAHAAGRQGSGGQACTSPLSSMHQPLCQACTSPFVKHATAPMWAPRSMAEQWGTHMWPALPSEPAAAHTCGSLRRAGSMGCAHSWPAGWSRQRQRPLSLPGANDKGPRLRGRTRSSLGTRLAGGQNLCREGRACDSLATRLAGGHKL